VHASPSSQIVVAGAFWSLQMGDPVAHDTAPTWHCRAGDSAHVLFGEHAPQLPEWQNMFAPQDNPSATAVCRHAFTGSQESIVQGLSSSQSSGAPAMQAPATHVSAPLHTSPSAQLVPSARA